MFENGQNNYENENNQFDGMSVSGVDNVTKKKGKKAALIGGISAAVIVGGSAAAYGLSDTVKNQVKLRLSKPEKYYAWVTENNSEALADVLSEKYAKALDKMEDGQRVKLKFSYAPTDEAKEEILEELIGSDYEDSDDEDDEQLRNIINKHDEYALSVDYSAKNGNINSNFGVDLSGERVLSFEAAADMEAFDLFFRVPELKEQWLNFELGIEEKIDDTDAAEYFDVYKDIVKDPASLLTPDELKKEINRYAGVWSNFANDVEVEKKESVDISDITVEYTVATVEMTEKDIAEFGMALLEELRDDEIAKKIITEKLDITDEEDYVSDISEAIDDIKEEIEDDELDDEEISLTVETYIDFTGTVRGLRFTNEYDDEFFMAIGMDDGNTRGVITFTEDEEETFSAKLVLDNYSIIKKNQEYSGYLSINSEDLDDEIKVEFNDFKVENEDKCYFDGDIVINIPDVDPIKFTCKTNGKKEEISYELVVDGTDYGKFALEYVLEDKISLDMPDKGDAYVIDAENTDDFEFEKYVSQKEFSKFINGILDDIGFTGDTAKDLADEITEDLYDEVEDALDDDDDWDDDYDWDYDDDDWDDYDWDKYDEPTTSSKDDKNMNNNDIDDDYDYDEEFASFDWDSLKYEDYKDFMTKEEFDDFVNEMKEYSEEYKKAS